MLITNTSLIITKSIFHKTAEELREFIKENDIKIKLLKLLKYLRKKRKKIQKGNLTKCQK